MFLSGSGGAILFAYLWTMLDVQPGGSEVLESTTDSEDPHVKRTRLGAPPRVAQRHKRAGSEMSDPDSESHDDGLRSGGQLSTYSLGLPRALMHFLERQ